MFVFKGDLLATIQPSTHSTPQHVNAPTNGMVRDRPGAQPDGWVKSGEVICCIDNVHGQQLGWPSLEVPHAQEGQAMGQSTSGERQHDVNGQRKARQRQVDLQNDLAINDTSVTILKGAWQ